MDLQLTEILVAAENQNFFCWSVPLCKERNDIVRFASLYKHIPVRKDFCDLCTDAVDDVIEPLPLLGILFAICPALCFVEWEEVPPPRCAAILANH